MRNVPIIVVFLFFFLFLAAFIATPVPAEIITARDLATLRDIEALSVSPNGEWAAFQVRQADPDANRYATAWHVVSTRGGNARRVADAGEPLQPAVMGRINGFILPVPPVWSPDGASIAYLKKESGRTQVWSARLDGRHTEQLTRNEGDVRALAWSKDSKRLLFETEPSRAQLSVALAKEGLDGHRYDNRFFPTYSPLPVLPRDVDFGKADGKRTTGSQEAARRVWVHDFANRKERPATADEQTEFALLTTAPKPEGRDKARGDAIISAGGARGWLEARDPELQGGYAPVTTVAQRARDSAPIVCDAAACTGQFLELVAWRNDEELLYLRREDPVFAERVLYAWSPATGAAREVLRTEDLFLGFEWKCAMGGERLICLYEEPDRPRRLVAIDPGTGAVEMLYDPNPDFARFDLGARPQRLIFRSKTGFENYGYLVLPPGYQRGERVPLVIVTYRCTGFLRGGTGDEYPVFPFAAAGHAVLCFDVPATDWQGAAREDHATRQNHERGPGDPGKRRVQDGLETAIAHLDGMGVIDPARVGITGLSFGGETVMYALFNMPRLAAGIASGTEIGPSSTFLYGLAGRALHKQWGLDSPTSKRWDQLSLARNADKVGAALLLNVPDRELIGDLEVFAALESAGKPVEMYVFPDEYHIKSQPAHRLAIYERNVDWMNFWLRGVEDSGSAKAEQYNRWRAMREKQCELRKGDDAPWYCVKWGHS